ncbi:hypothetical protein NL499_28715, partial [Klebsiella pneumoniae]|nr:hypothetical protein [Klebsiella pneumoniae]
MENWWSGMVDGFNSKKGANALIGLGSGLLSQPTFAKGLAAGGQGFMQGAELDQQYAAEETKLADGNRTMEWVKANYPQ